jgi:hypothetical protein
MYIQIEKLEKNVATFAYVFRTGENSNTAPPVKEFHSTRPDARRRVVKKAAKWIIENGFSYSN